MEESDRNGGFLKSEDLLRKDGLFGGDHLGQNVWVFIGKICINEGVNGNIIGPNVVFARNV